MSYSQNREDEIIANWFGQYVGTVLEIGANDGVTYSNSLHLIEKGWSAVLVEPSARVFWKMCDRHKGSKNVIVVNAAIAEHVGSGVLYDSGDFLLKGTSSLLSTMKPSEIKRWGDVQFEETHISVLTFYQLLQDVPYKQFDFISIDCEGYDLEVLRQIELDSVGCKMYLRRTQ